MSLKRKIIEIYRDAIPSWLCWWTTWAWTSLLQPSGRSRRRTSPTSRPPPSTSSPTSSRHSRSRESFQRLQRNRKNWDILAKTNKLEELHNFRNWSHNTEGQLKESEHQTRSGWNSNCKAHLPNCGLIGGSILTATSIFKVRKLVGISRLIEMNRKWLQSHAKRRG